jgi:hypothetical protein
VCSKCCFGKNSRFGKELFGKVVAMVSVLGERELKWTVIVCWELVCISPDLVCISLVVENLGGLFGGLFGVELVTGELVRNFLGWVSRWVWWVRPWAPISGGCVVGKGRGG